MVNEGMKIEISKFELGTFPGTLGDLLIRIELSRFDEVMVSFNAEVALSL